MVLVKNLSFLLLFVFGETGPEKVFGDDVNRKLAYQDYKSIGLRNSKNCNFFLLFVFDETEPEKNSACRI